MKKTLLTILGAILVGFGLGLFFFKKFDTNIEALATSVKSIYAVQVGVYKNIDNAKDVANKMEGIVVLDNDYYINTLIEAAKKYSGNKYINKGENIHRACKTGSYAYILNDGTKLRWMYYEDYLKKIS